MKTYKSPLPEISLKFTNTNHNKSKITKSTDAYKTLLALYDPDTIEYIETAIVLFLNRANNTIGWFKISNGGTACAIVDSKVLYATALKSGASAYILSHNHPSGNLYPSEPDIKLTNELNQIGKLLDLKMLDHLIITPEGFYSFADQGLLYLS